MPSWGRNAAGRFDAEFAAAPLAAFKRSLARLADVGKTALEFWWRGRWRGRSR